MKKAVFIDKDGTLIKDVPYNVNPQLIALNTTAAEALQLLQQHGYLLIVISNQAGVALGYFDEEALVVVSTTLYNLLAEQSVALNGFYYCPHHLEGIKEKYAQPCSCRKPQPGLFFKAAKENQIELAKSWMIGDILDDVEAGNRAGCKTILLNNGNETEWLLDNDMRMYTNKVATLLEAAKVILDEELA